MSFPLLRAEIYIYQRKTRFRSGIDVALRKAAKHAA